MRRDPTIESGRGPTRCSSFSSTTILPSPHASVAPGHGVIRAERHGRRAAELKPPAYPSGKKPFRSTSSPSWQNNRHVASYPPQFDEDFGADGDGHDWLFIVTPTRAIPPKRFRASTATVLRLPILAPIRIDPPRRLTDHIQRDDSTSIHGGLEQPCVFPRDRIPLPGAALASRLAPFGRQSHQMTNQSDPRTATTQRHCTDGGRDSAKPRGAAFSRITTDGRSAMRAPSIHSPNNPGDWSISLPTRPASTTMNAMGTHAQFSIGRAQPGKPPPKKSKAFRKLAPQM